MRVEVLALDQPDAPVIAIVTTANGRSDGPILEGDAFKPGRYELRFHVGDYFGAAAPFLDIVPVAFTVSDAHQHYHVPLLVSPFAYSTYRGS